MKIALLFLITYTIPVLLLTIGLITGFKEKHKNRDLVLRNELLKLKKH